MPIRHHGFLASASKSIILRLAHAPHDPSSLSFHARNTSSEAYRQRIAVIGGGITGLTAAYCLSKRQDISVTLYEGSDRLGGWIQSKHVDVPGGRVLFELGPRTLRPGMPNGVLTAGLAEELGLANDMVFTSKNSVAVRGRWIYYPDHFVQMPHASLGFWNNLWSLLTEPVFRGFLPAAFRDFLKSKRRQSRSDDESIGAFISRRLGRQVVENLVSPVIHGIYAGDVDELSSDMIFPALRFGEAKSDSLVLGMIDTFSILKDEDAELISRWSKTKPPISDSLNRKLNECSTFTFRGGISQLATKLEEVLRGKENVDLRFGGLATTMMPDGADQKVEVRTIAKKGIYGSLQANETAESNSAQQRSDAAAQALKTQKGDLYDQVIQTDPRGITIPGADPLQSELSSSSIPSATVGVVNLYYSDPNILPISGFGYLIPKSIPFSQNPEMALGVVFDSDAVRGQDTVPGTKLTVMLGGHWWRDFGDLHPSEEECLRMAKSVVRRHLGIKDDPTASKATIQKQSIPQYPVHYRRNFLNRDHNHLVNKYYGRLKVAGAFFNGVGVNDCIRGGIEVAQSALSPNWRDKTGLEVISNAPAFAKLARVRSSQNQK